jgi:hypothetical protein
MRTLIYGAEKIEVGLQVGLPQTVRETVELVSSLVPALGPTLVNKFTSSLPFLNPQLVDDMVVLSTVFAVTGGLGAMGLSKSSLVWRRGGIIGGLILAVASLVLLLLTSLDIAFASNPALALFITRLSYVLLFLSISIVVGAVVS